MGFHNPRLTKMLTLLSAPGPTLLIFLDLSRSCVFIQSFFELSAAQGTRCQRVGRHVIVMTLEEYLGRGGLFNCNNGL